MVRTNGCSGPQLSSIGPPVRFDTSFDATWPFSAIMPFRVSKNIAKIPNVIFIRIFLVFYICVCILSILLTLIQKSHPNGWVCLAHNCDWRVSCTQNKIEWRKTLNPLLILWTVNHQTLELNRQWKQTSSAINSNKFVARSICWLQNIVFVWDSMFLWNTA